MKQDKYWDSVADKKNFTTTFDENEFGKYVDKGARLLDVGCGYGRTLNELYMAGYENLVGVDSSEKMLERGMREFPYLDFVKNDTDLPFEDNSFDAVILFGVLTAIVDNDAQAAIIKEIFRVLKPNGIIYVNDFLVNGDISRVLKYLKCKKAFGVYGVYRLSDGVVLRHHTEKYIAKLLSRFQKLEYVKLKFKTMNGGRSNGFYYIGRNKK
ncbi:MAG: class I SAM-dependent methyltransferase [Eubacterium sp.]|nr:class I SAM-dependent methyltransferase [Eubacterium sp.]